jgi:16S rRNA (adenine1518-N6/adenine1519-N6)-dimethyltransferase
VIRKIVAAIDPQPEQNLVEIGPGRGAITTALLDRAGEMDVIELDRDVIPLLEESCADRGLLRVHNADALRFNFAGLSGDGGSLRVVGNLPYNISTPLLFHLIGQLDVIEDMHFMLQKEVVTRMAARPDTRQYGRLTVMLAVACDVEPLFDIGPGAFSPPPRVRSAFVRLRPLKQGRPTDSVQQALAELVRQAFSKRRKTLRNALAGIMDVDAIIAADCDPAVRPDAIDVDAYLRLARKLAHGDPQQADKR